MLALVINVRVGCAMHPQSTREHHGHTSGSPTNQSSARRHNRSSLAYYHPNKSTLSRASDDATATSVSRNRTSHVNNNSTTLPDKQARSSHSQQYIHTYPFFLSFFPLRHFPYFIFSVFLIFASLRSSSRFFYNILYQSQ